MVDRIVGSHDADPAERVAWVLSGALATVPGALVEVDSPRRFYVTDELGQIVLVRCQTIARRHHWPVDVDEASWADVFRLLDR